MFADKGFQAFRIERPLPPQRWWRRLFGIKRPAGKVYVGFTFRGSKLHHIEAEVNYPENVDFVEVEFRVWNDGSLIRFYPPLTVIAQ